MKRLVRPWMVVFLTVAIAACFSSIGSGQTLPGKTWCYLTGNYGYSLNGNGDLYAQYGSCFPLSVNYANHTTTFSNDYDAQIIGLQNEGFDAANIDFFVTSNPQSSSTVLNLGGSSNMGGTGFGLFLKSAYQNGFAVAPSVNCSNDSSSGFVSDTENYIEYYCEALKDSSNTYYSYASAAAQTTVPGISYTTFVISTYGDKNLLAQTMGTPDPSTSAADWATIISTVNAVGAAQSTSPVDMRFHVFWLGDVVAGFSTNSWDTITNSTTGDIYYQLTSSPKMDMAYTFTSADPYWDTSSFGSGPTSYYAYVSGTPYSVPFIGGMWPGKFRGYFNGNPVNPTTTDALDTQYLRKDWAYHHSFGVSNIHLSTFDDVQEQSDLQPDSDWGTTRSDLTSWFISLYKGNTSAPWTDARIYLTTPMSMYFTSASSAQKSSSIVHDTVSSHTPTDSNPALNAEALVLNPTSTTLSLIEQLYDRNDTPIGSAVTTSTSGSNYSWPTASAPNTHYAAMLDLVSKLSSKWPTGSVPVGEYVRVHATLQNTSGQVYATAVSAPILVYQGSYAGVMPSMAYNSIASNHQTPTNPELAVSNIATQAYQNAAATVSATQSSFGSQCYFVNLLQNTEDVRTSSDGNGMDERYTVVNTVLDPTHPIVRYLDSVSDVDNRNTLLAGANVDTLLSGGFLVSRLYDDSFNVGYSDPTWVSTRGTVTGPPPGVISIEFGSNGTTGDMGTLDRAGIADSNYWNNADGASSSSALSLYDNNGLAVKDSGGTSTNTTWTYVTSANSLATSSGSDYAGNYRMMKYNLNNTNSGGGVSITVSNIPASYGSTTTGEEYDAYVYGLTTGANNTLPHYKYTIGSTTYYVADPGSSFSGSFTKVTSTFSGSPGSGNYVVFSNLQSSSFTLTAISTDSSFQQCPINAIQIVPHPF